MFGGGSKYMVAADRKKVRKKNGGKERDNSRVGHIDG